MPSPQMQKVARYVVSGGTSTLTNLLILFLLVHYLAVWYLLASIISFLASTIVSFVLQKFWTFRDRATAGMHFQFTLYAGITGFNIGVNTALMYLFVSVFGIWYLLAQILSGGLIALMSFFAYQKLVFKAQA